MTKKKILLADSSSIVRKIISKELSGKSFEIIEVSDGFELLREIQNITPDILIISEQLKYLSGVEITSIIKNDLLFSSIPIVLITVESEMQQMLLKKESIVDEVLYLSEKNIEELVSTVRNLTLDKKEDDNILTDNHSSENNTLETGSVIKSAKTQNKAKKQQTDKDLVAQITQYYEKNSFKNKVTKDLFSSVFLLQDIDIFMEKLFVILDSVCLYDIALFSIKDGNNVLNYCITHKPFTTEETTDFIKVCHSTFEDNCNCEEEYSFLPCSIKEEIYPDANSSKIIKTYEFVTLFANDFIGTLHLGTVKQNSIGEEQRNKLYFFTEMLSPLLELLLSYKKTVQEQKLIRKAFSSFVPDEVVDELIQGAGQQDEFTGEKRHVAVLICDIRNFTTISELNKPEVVVSFLNSYFTAMVDIVRQNGGSIDKFMGDAIMALFGAPVSYEDNGRRAVDAALGMIRALKNIDTSMLTMPEGLSLKIGIGIHYGEVILGSIGCREKTDYTVIGDAVNLASRLEGLTKQYGSDVIVTEPVKKELNESYYLRCLDRVKVKGKSIPVSIYSIEESSDKYTKKYIDLYSKAIELYQVGAWNLAIEYFNKAILENKEDKAAFVMIKRCEEFLENPPENWDGAISLTSK